MSTITKGPIGEQDFYQYDGVNSTFSRLNSDGYTMTLNTVGGEVDALMAYGGGVNYTAATITSALTAIGTTNKVSVVLRPGTWVIGANTDWSAYTNVTFRILPGALISHGAYTLNIPNVDAGLYQIFSGTGAVTFSGPIKEVYPEWWGAVGDGTTDDVVALQAAADSLSSGGLLKLAGGGTNYLIKASWVINYKIWVLGRGWKETTSYTAATTITKDATLDDEAIEVKAGRVILQNFAVEGAAGNGGIGIQLLENGIQLVNIGVYNQGGDGIRVGDESNTNVNSTVMYNVTSNYHGRYGVHYHSQDRNANAGTAVNLQANLNTSDGIYVNNSHVNTFVGLLVEENGGWGVHFAAAATKNVIIGGDLDEGNTLGDLYLESGSEQNTIYSPSLLYANTTDDGDNTIHYCDINYKTLVIKRSANIDLSNGNNDDVPLPTSSFARIVGPTGAWGITGFVANKSGYRLLITNGTGLDGTIYYDDAGSAAANRIWTSGGTDVAIPNLSTMEFVYDDIVSKWQMIWVKET